MVHWIDTRDKSSLAVDTATAIPRVTGSLSIISSGLIIFMMVIDRKWKLTKPNHRILLLMSIFDVISSIAHVMSSSKYCVFYSFQCVHIFHNWHLNNYPDNHVVYTINNRSSPEKPRGSWGNRQSSDM